jgi:LPXTG-motif cell wall-anchored protein
MIWLALAVVVQQGASAPQEPRVQMGVTIQPDTVTVGDPYLVMVRVRAPAGTRMAFPAPPDTGGTVEGVDPVIERAVTTDPNAEDRTAIYRLAAWDTGQVSVELGDVELTGAVERTLAIQDPTVFVRSVLPADTALQVPKEARDIFAAEGSWWWLILLGLLAAAIIGVLFWWWWRRRKRPRPRLVEDPFVRAEREFAALADLGLPEAGEPGRHVALATEVLLDYLGGRVSEADPSFTTSELMRALIPRRELPLEALGHLLQEADLVKFARRPVSVERSHAFAAEALELVRRVEHVEQARLEAERARTDGRKAAA